MEMIKAKWLMTIIATLGLLSFQPASADENLWVYTKGTDTRPEGSTEIKLNSISRFNKDSGDYTFHDIRPEIEYGITDYLTVGAALMIFSHDYSVDDPDLEPMFETQGGAGSTFKKTQIGGYEIKLKYNILSPYKDALGLSLGFAYERRDKYRLDGADIDQDSFVPMIFLQKNFLDDTLVFAFMGKMEFERRKSPGVLEEEIALDFALGVSYRFQPKWFVGLEFRHQSDYLCPEEEGVCDPELQRSSWDLGDFKIGTQHQNGNYLGPSIHYAEEKWYATAGILFQIFGGGSQFAFVRDNKNWDEHEKYHLGFSFGYNF
ncbi:MAG: DUF6662 family protein [Pseudomonadota bacterium]